MDILTDIFHSAGLAKSLLVSQQFYKPWAATFPCQKSMGFHVMSQGEGYIRSPLLKEPIHLKRGDIAMIRRGFDHEVATDLKVKAKPLGETHSVETNDKKPLMVLVSGVYQFQTEPIHALFSEIPKVLVIRSEDIPPHSPLNASLQLLSAEVSQPHAGSEAVTKSLIDLMFHYIFRDWIEEQKSTNSAWSLALKDEHLKKAISAMHAEYSKDWNVDELADVAGLSRAAFSQKFKKITGETPAMYLSKIRIQKAMDMLRATNANFDTIAESVGYNDSFVFSKAFKRLRGVSPKDYRKQAQAS